MLESRSEQKIRLSKKIKGNLKRNTALLVCTSLVFLGGTFGNLFNKPAQAAVGTHVVISEIYGGGGNSGSSYKNDYIELYNPTNSSVSLSGWSIQYASSTGAFSNITNLSGSIGAHQYILIKEASGGGGTIDLPTADVTGTINLSASSGKVALAKATTAVSGSADSNVVDFVGFGSANDSETTPVGTLSATTSVERKDNNGGTAQGQGNGWDTNNNANDFVNTSSIVPQNSSSTAEPSTETQTGTDNDHIGLGNPSGATSNTSNSNNYLMVKSQYDLSYNNSKHEPNWVSWHVGSSDLGSAARQDDFRADTTLPSGWYQVTASEFSGSGFDRGHMCPSADRTSTVANNSATFLMSNMIPQAPNNNEVTWANLEEYSRSLVTAGNELYVVSGGYGSGGTGSNGYKTTVGNGVVVPAKTWKVIVVLPNGNNDLSRVTASTRVIAVVLPNDQTTSSHPWSYYRVSVDSIESLTGYDFLSSVPANVQSAIEASVDNGPTN
ncbi:MULTISPECIES: DNA/RNA non-specific endonuclease [Bacillaceae]|uniref:DNA/RNA non-specific endonuclease n=1 Tax=Bacillaceae TaxID=186817 RepID=UPI0008E81BBA|nr:MULTISPECIES: DNA/RNA non-specific endonuclease [Bacillaceae]PGZ94513.1 endonuclease [Bacillus sp. AFS029533]SFD80248.1 endonuclease G [Bacillus sp. UNCCL81]